MIKYLEKENFDDEIAKGRILVDFYATWCGPCKMLSGVLENVEDSIGMPILKIDVDKHEELARRFRVMSIPTVILFEDGKEVKKKIGFMNEKKVSEVISE